MAFTAAGFDASTCTCPTSSPGPFPWRTSTGSRRRGLLVRGSAGRGCGMAHAALRHGGCARAFAAFFARDDAFASRLQRLASSQQPCGAPDPRRGTLPHFKPNRSGRFEARVAQVEIVDSPTTQDSVFLRGMGGSRLPWRSAHGEAALRSCLVVANTFDAQDLRSGAFVGNGWSDGSVSA